MMGIHPDHRDSGVGFALKRAQWQMVRHQGIDRITWTYDPLLSRNAHLNVARLGAVCNTYWPDFYGEMRDALNAGLPSDRFEVDWWVYSRRVERRLSRQARASLRLSDFRAAGTPTITPILETPLPLAQLMDGGEDNDGANLVLVEIPADFSALRAADPALGLAWRLRSRDIIGELFRRGYIVTDFLYEPGLAPSSFYVLSYGEATLR
jgi:predicted GNAT superfamily acetyltransferase